MSVSEFPGRTVGTPIEPPATLPEGSCLAFDPPGGRVKFTSRAEGPVVYRSGTGGVVANCRAVGPGSSSITCLPGPLGWVGKLVLKDCFATTSEGFHLLAL